MDSSAQFKNYLLNQNTPASKATVKNYLSDVNRFTAWYEAKFGTQFTGTDVNYDLVDLFKTESLATRSASSVQRNISTLRKFFTFLKLEGIVSESPFDAEKVSSREIPTDPWMIRDFKNYLFVLNASTLTIKNYIIDVNQFKQWIESTLPSDGADIHEVEAAIRSIDSRLISEYKHRLLENLRLNPTSVNRKLSSLRKYTSWAQEQGIIKPDNQSASNAHLVAAPLVIPASDSFDDQSQATQPDKPYSKFPPLRLFQKSTRGTGLLLSSLLIAPIVYLASQGNKVSWALKGKPIFESVKNKNSLQSILQPLEPPVGPVRNIPKSFYAPTRISVASLPVQKQVWHHMRYSRPEWYRRYHSYTFTSYLHFAILLLFILLSGYTIFTNNNFQDKNSAVLATPPVAPERVLSFQGRITDKNGVPIKTGTNLRMSIYTSEGATGSALLWEEVDFTDPDEDGIFNVLLGQNNPIPQTLFSNNPALWLGVAVENTEELDPRQRIATVAYAANAETIQGLEPITGSNSTANVILALNSSGNLTIGGSASPTFQATGGEFTISGQTVVLTSEESSDGNVQISPDGNGLVDIQSAITNTSNNNSITPGSVQIDDILTVNISTEDDTAFGIHQNSTGDLIEANVSGDTRFLVDNGGNITIDGNVNGLTVSSGTITSGAWSGTAIDPESGGTGLDTTASTGVPYISSGTWSIDSNYLGSNHGGTGLDTSASTGIPVIASGTWSVDNDGLNVDQGGTGITSYTSGDILYANGATSLSTLGIGGNGTCLSSDGASPSWVACGSFVVGSIWSEAFGATYLNNFSTDILVGGGTTESAKFAVLNISETRGNQVASLSGDIVLDKNASIQTTDNQTLTIGGSTTGEIIIDSGSGLITFADPISLTGDTTIGGDLKVAGGDITIGTSQALSDASGTLTLSNVDTLDSTTESTIEDAIDTLSNLTSASSLSTIGTITTGTWNADALSDAYVADNISIDDTGSVHWDALNNFPTGCSAGDAVTTIGGTLTCGTFLQSEADTLAAVVGRGDTTTDLVNLNGGIQSQGARTGLALLTLDETGDQNILTASASGVTQFTIERDGDILQAGDLTVSGGNLTVGTSEAFIDLTGNLQLTNVDTLDAITKSTIEDAIDALSNLTSASTLATVGTLNSGDISSGFGNIDIGNSNLDADGTITFGSFSTDGGLIYTTGTGELAQVTVQGSSGQCLLSNGAGSAPSFSPCPGGGSGENLWQQAAGGILTPGNLTQDLVLGATSTDSAKFAFINSGSTSLGTPTASISANSGDNALFITGDGSIQTTNRQTLTIGGGDTGDIAIAGTITTGIWNGTALTDANVSDTLTSSLFVGSGSTTTAVDLATAEVAGILSNANVADDLTISSTGSVDWLALTNYPTGCGAGEAVTAVGGTLTCDTFLQTDTDTNYWQLNGPVLSPGNLTTDLLIGGTSTASARFGFLNITSDTKVPTATISATDGYALSLNADGYITTTQGETLTLGGGDSGDVYTASVLRLDATNGIKGGGLSDCDNPTTSKLLWDASTNRFSCGTDQGGAGGASITVRETDLSPAVSAVSVIEFGPDPNSDDEFIVSDEGSGIARIRIGDEVGMLNQAETVTGGWTFNTSTTTFTTGILANGGIDTTSNSDLELGANGTGEITLASDFDSGINIGSTSNTPAPLSVSGGIGGNAAFVLDQLNSGDIFTASASGTTRFSISNAGAFALEGAYGGSGDCLKSGGDSASAVYWGTCGTGGGGTSYWTINEGNGTIAPINETVDLIIGGTSTASAKFAVLNIAGGTPTATISANNGDNALFIRGDGTLATTNSQTLTLGGSTTGDIVIDSGSGNIIFPDTNFSFTGASTIFTSTGDLTLDAGGGQTILSDGSTLSVGGIGGGLSYNIFANGGTSTDHSLTGDEDLLLGDDLEVDGVIYADGGIDTTFSLNGGVLYTDGSGVLAQTAVGDSGNCLVSQGGGAPQWQSCSGAGGSNWSVAGGRITPIHTTVLDFLLGSDATGSAKFAVLNISDGIPTASVSSDTTAAYLTGEGVLSTTSYQQLSIGNGGTTGDIVIDSGTDVVTIVDDLNITGGISFEGSVTVEDGEYIGLGAGSGRIVFTNTITDELDIQDANIDMNTNLITNIGNANTDFTTGGGLTLAGTLTTNGTLTANGVVTLGNGDSDNIAINSGVWDINAAGVGSGFTQLTVDNIDLNGDEVTFSSTAPSIIVGDTGTLTFTDGSNTLLSVEDRGSAGALVIADSGVISVGGSGSTVAYSVFGDSTTGAFGTDIDSDDDVYIEGNLEVDGTVRFNDNSLTFPTGAGSSGYVLTTNGSGTLDWTEIAGTIERWGDSSGALYALNETWDFLIGGQSTESAAFAFKNVIDGTPTASISANSGDIATYITGDGNLATTNNQTLTIGGSSTGNIVLSPLNGAVGGAILPSTDNQTNIGASSSARFKDLYLGPDSVHLQCLIGDGCGQNLDFELGIDPTGNDFYIAVNGVTNKAFSVTEGGDVDILGELHAGTANAFMVDTSGNVVTNGNVTTSGTTGITLNGAGADLIFANGEQISNDTDSTITLRRNDAGTVTLTAADNDSTAAFSILSGGAAALTLDTGGAAALNLGTTNATTVVLGSGSLDSFTVNTNGTGDSEVVLPEQSIGSTEILDNTLDFSDISNSPSLDATTTITTGTNNLVTNLNSSGDYIIQDNGTAFATFEDNGNITLGKTAAAGTINIGTGTGIDTINIGTGTVGSDVITIGGNTGTVAIDGTNFDLSSAGVVTMSEELILSAVSGEGISGGGLADCDGTTDKLQWDSTTNQFSCGTDSSITEVFDAYDNAGGTAMSTGITVNLDTVRKNSNGAVYTLSADELTIDSPGTYTFQYRVTGTLTSGTRGAFRIYLEENTGGGFAEIDGSRAYGYGRITTYPEATAVGFITTDVASGSAYRIRAQNESATFSTVVDASNLLVTKVDGSETGGGGGGIAGIGIRESDGSPTVTEATTIEFGPATTSTDEFIVSDQSGVARIRLGNMVAMLNEAETVTGGWSFSTGNTTFSSGILANGGIDTASNNDLTLSSDGTGDILFDIDGDSNIQIAASAVPAVDMFQITNTGYGITSDDVNGIDLTFATDAVIGARTNAAINVDVTSGATEGTDTLYGINLSNIIGQGGTEIALNIGTGWDTAIDTNGGDIDAGLGTLTAATLDASGATSLTLGSGDVTELIVTTDSTGDSEVQLPTNSIGTSEILDNTITATDIATTLTFTDGDYIDMSPITHDDSALQGLRLPQNTTLTNPSAGEGFLAYNSDTNVVQVFDGSDWVSIAGAATLNDIYAESVTQVDTNLEVDDTSGLTFNLTTTGDLVIQDDGTAFATFDNTGITTIGKAAATSTLNLGTGTAADTINIGTDATTGDTITIGNNNASTQVSILGGDYNDWYIEATGAAKFNNFAGAGLYSDCSLSTDKLIWDASTQTFSCGTDSDSGGNPNLQNVLEATSDGTTRDSNANTVNWNWDFTSAGSDAGLNISESTASTNGEQDDQALVRITTLSGSTAAPIQITSAGGDVADSFIDLTGGGDFEIRDNGSSFATFLDNSSIALGNNTSTFVVDATNVDVSAGGTLTLYGTTDITVDNNSDLVIASAGTGDIEFQTDGDSTFAITGLTNCDTIDTDGSGRLSCGSDATGGGTGSLDDSYNNGGTITVDAYDVLFNLNDDSNDYGVVIDASVDGLIDTAFEVTTTGGVSSAFTTAIDVSDAGITTALDVGGNAITGTTYAITASTGLTLGSGSETVAIDSSDWDIDATGNVTGVGTINADGNLTITKADPAIMLDASITNDTDFWIGGTEDGGGDDDDLLQIGKGLVPGTAPLLTLDANGRFGIGVTAPTVKLDVAGAASASGALTLAGASTISTTENGALTIGSASTGDINFYSAANTLTDAGNLTLAGDIEASGTLIADTWDGNGAVALTIGSGDISSLTVTTSGTGNNAVVLPNESISTLEITNNSLTPTDFAATMTYSDGDYIDLGAITHDDITPQGLRLPQADSFLNPSSGEGYLAWDTTGAGELQIYDGTSWTSVGGDSSFDAVYAQSVTDTDVSMEIDNASGLQFDLTSSGDFTIEDEGTAIAAFEALGGLTFSPQNTEDFVIDVDGDSTVGIGTSDPLATLDVRGTASISGDLTLAGGGRTISTTDNGSLTLGDSNTGNVEFFSSSNNITDSGDLTIAGSLTSDGITADGGITVSSGQSIDFSTSATSITGDGTDLTLDDSYLTSGITLSESGETGLNSYFSATSIIGAINELASDPVINLSWGESGTHATGQIMKIHNGTTANRGYPLSYAGEIEDIAVNADTGPVGAGETFTVRINQVNTACAVTLGAGSNEAYANCDLTFSANDEISVIATGSFTTSGNDTQVVVLIKFDGVGYDLAELYPSSQALGFGEVVSIDPDNPGQIIRSEKAYDPNAIGIISTKPGEVIGVWEPGMYALALAGRVPVKITESNGEIKAGDPLVSSDIPGVAMKATKSGLSIGRALEDANCENDIDCEVLAFVETNYSNPQVIDEILEKEGLTMNTLPDGYDISRTILARMIQKNEDISPSKSTELNTDRVLAGLEIVTPEVTTKELAANIITPVDENLSIVLSDESALTIGSSDSAEITFDNSGNASFSGTLIAEQVKTGYAELGRIVVETASLLSANIVDLSADSLSIATENITIAGENIRDYIAGIVDERIDEREIAISSPILETDELKPSGDTLSIALPTNDDSSSFEVKNSSESAVFSVDAAGDASLSGTLSSDGINTDEASVSGTLRAGRIDVDELNLSDEALSNLQNSINATSSPTINNYYYNEPQIDEEESDATGSATLKEITADYATFTNGLISYGSTSFFDATVANNLYVGAQLSISDSSINVLGTNLQIQPLAQGGVEFVGGKIAIDVEGNLEVNGDAYFAKDVDIAGSLATNIIKVDPVIGLAFQFEDLGDEVSNIEFRTGTGSAVLSFNNQGDINSSGSGTFNKLNLNIVPEAIALSDTEIIATGSAGTSEIKPYQNELTINNPLVTEESLIYITPKTSLPNQSIYLLRQVAGESFTVGISRVVEKAVPFNWVLIN